MSASDFRSDLPDFKPRRWLANGHLQTIFGNFLPRAASTLPEATRHLVETTPARGSQIATQVLCECHWQPAKVRSERPTAIIVHGLEGSSRSQYVGGNAQKLWDAGFNIIRMNMRNCGGKNYEMARLSPTLYHSGLSIDVEAVMHHFIASEGLQSIALIGYSMGGNLVLKLAGDLGRNAPPQLQAVVGVSPAMDLGPSADALHQGINRVYEWKFMRDLVRRFRHKAALFPRAYDVRLSYGLGSLRQFDDRITALYAGFRSADDYYQRAAAARVMQDISIPTLIIHAQDDPFIRVLPTTRVKIEHNPHIALIEPAHGGHCAFLAEPDHARNFDGYWAEHLALRFVQAHVAVAAATS
ncbi:YheT family hydrolase [Granulicella cerasi]|uniref:YheT family hydrolase n=1 Tax=Granulicella cerasi TaxID=741063 RepID=A0ABW1Z5U0_9BACT|nr:alpha/beta fold hydrolase [Granulicella cerasi]